MAIDGLNFSHFLMGWLRFEVSMEVLPAVASFPGGPLSKTSAEKPLFHQPRHPIGAAANPPGAVQNNRSAAEIPSQLSMYW